MLNNLPFQKDTFEWAKLFVEIFKLKLKRQDIIKIIFKNQKKKKSTKLLNFSSKLFETKLTEADIYFCEKIKDPNINDNMIKGFKKFFEMFRLFFGRYFKS